MSSPRRHQDYAIGWICPLPVEQTIALLMLDETHDRLTQQPADQNIYTLGSIGDHNIVIAGLHQPGNSPAATVVTQMRNTFPNIHYVLLVGIGGGVPVRTESDWVRLGDVVVCKPIGEYPGVVQYDTGKAEVGQFKRIGALPPPPVVLLQAAQDMEVKRSLLRTQDDPIAKCLQRIPSGIPALKKYLYPGFAKDRLYHNDYIHKQPGVPCDECKCDLSRLRRREDPENTNEYVRVHRGVIASGGMVIKDANQRDDLAGKYGVLCFETEAAGTLADLPALVIRGIADYCDSHKNDLWHGYAAATAAAYARQLILHMPTYSCLRSVCATWTSNDIQIDPLAHLFQQMQTLRQTASRLESSISDRRKELVAWIGALSAQTPGTCRWILQRTQFKAWAALASEVSKVLWIRGGPGCGKTILTANIIRHVTTYFFCRHEDERKRDLNEIARSWVQQIVNRMDDAVSIVYPLCEQNKSRAATMTEIWEILSRVCHGIHNCMLFLDGLDDFLARLWRTISGTTARVLISSRTRQDTITFLEHNIAIEDTAQDIIDYSTSIVNERLGISKDVARKCDGMFLWNKNQIRRTLGKIHSIVNLGINEKAWAIGILRWTYFAVRPLTVRELTEALLTETNTLTTFPFNEMPDAWDEYYSLIDIRGSPAASITTHTVHFIHTSVKEFLSQTSISAKEHELLARTCLTYLCLDDVAVDDPYDLHTLQDRKETFQFLEYASLCWYDHISRSENVLFDPSSTRWMMWSEMFSQNLWPGSTLHPIKEHNGPTPLPIVSCLGLLDTMKWLLSLGSDIDATVGRFGSALHSAAGRCQKNTAQFLLENGADKNKQGGMYGYPISADIVDMLLKAGADISCRDQTGCKTLIILLRNGATVDDHDGHQRTPLFLAAAHGHKLITELLIERGAEVSTRDVDNRTPLFAAIQNGHIPIVEVLTKHGVDVRTQDNAGLTPLHIAVKLGHPQMVDLLLRHGADANAADRDGVTPVFVAHRGQVNCKTPLQARTPLHAACAATKEATTVQLLLDHGAEVDAADNHGFTPLFYAAGNGSPAIVELLIQYNAQVNATQKEGLHTLAIEALLKHGECHLLSGECVSLRGNKYRPVVQPLVRAAPVHLAVQIGDVGILELLLENDAAVNTLTDKGLTPVHIALLLDNDAALLLDNGADVNALADKGLTPLHIAVMEGKQDIVQLLLDNGADVNAGKDEITLMYLAIGKRDELITTSLVRHGAEIDVPLVVAIKQGDEDTVRFILQHAPEIGPEFLIYGKRYGHDHILQLMVEHFLAKDAVD
ncbi:ankyrin repeat-containing domain protein [Aspergillus novoparasiticus]|uniref:Ankyrin repeat-containing domain protein n=1 Tax=Aspergillus novoparasiticus TaxID=986946 RepID=A0A5N6EDG7_9EURO|nr:ankyrin repeat-containing domain protein [Aspergillus novoparasiticus]